jgi:hypothetical protein
MSEEREKLLSVLNNLPISFLTRIVEFMQITAPHALFDVVDESIIFDIDRLDVRVYIEMIINNYNNYYFFFFLLDSATYSSIL